MPTVCHILEKFEGRLNGIDQRLAAIEVTDSTGDGKFVGSLWEVSGNQIAVWSVDTDRPLSWTQGQWARLAAGKIEARGTAFDFQSSDTGARIVFDGTQFAGYSDATTKEFYLDATTGKGYFAGGNAILSKDGIVLSDELFISWSANNTASEWVSGISCTLWATATEASLTSFHGIMARGVTHPDATAPSFTALGGIHMAGYHYAPGTLATLKGAYNIIGAFDGAGIVDNAYVYGAYVLNEEGCTINTVALFRGIGVSNAGTIGTCIGLYLPELSGDVTFGIQQVGASDKNYFAGLMEISSFKMSTGSGAGKVLVSDADGVGTWEAAGGTVGDMLKSVYDTDNDGVVDDSEKLEGSTKAQVLTAAVAAVEAASFTDLVAGEYKFTTNLFNYFSEYWGIVANLADADGVHYFKIRDSDGVVVFAVDSDGVVTTGPAYCTRWPAWDEVTGKPSEFTPSTHVLATTGPHTGTLPWTDLSKTGSSLADLVTRDHDLLGGLTDDDHSQYHNNARGDARYLYRENVGAFTPDGDYEPATKKYVDDNIGALPNVAGAGYTLVSDGVNSWVANQTPAWTGTHTFGDANFAHYASLTSKSAGGQAHYTRDWLQITTSSTNKIFLTSADLVSSASSGDKVAVFGWAAGTGTCAVFGGNFGASISNASGQGVGTEINLNNYARHVTGEGDSFGPVALQVIGGPTYRSKFGILIGHQVSEGWITGLKFYGNVCKDYGINMQDLTGVTHAILLPNNVPISALATGGAAVPILWIDGSNYTTIRSAGGGFTFPNLAATFNLLKVDDNGTMTVDNLKGNEGWYVRVHADGSLYTAAA